MIYTAQTTIICQKLKHASKKANIKEVVSSFAAMENA